MLDVTITGGGTIADLVNELIAAGYNASVVDADTIALTMTAPDNDSFFAFDFSDFDAANGGVTEVSGAQLTVAMTNNLSLRIVQVDATTRSLSFDSVAGEDYQLEMRRIAYNRWLGRRRCGD